MAVAVRCIIHFTGSHQLLRCEKGQVCHDLASSRSQTPRRNHSHCRRAPVFAIPTNDNLSWQRLKPFSKRLGRAEASTNDKLAWSASFRPSGTRLPGPPAGDFGVPSNRGHVAVEPAVVCLKRHLFFFFPRRSRCVSECECARVRMRLCVCARVPEWSII